MSRLKWQKIFACIMMESREVQKKNGAVNLQLFCITGSVALWSETKT
jgi:hypothetical protein